MREKTSDRLCSFEIQEVQARFLPTHAAILYNPKVIHRVKFNKFDK